jgi:hypothetical protein
MGRPRVFADFNNTEPKRRLRLNCIGTIEDLARQRITLRDGQQLTLSGDELEAVGTVEYSAEEGLWVANIDWNAIREETASAPVAGEQPDKSAA